MSPASPTPDPRAAPAVRAPDALARALRRVTTRLRAQRALEDAATAALPGGALAALALGAAALRWIDAGETRAWLAAGALLPLLGVAAGALRRVPRLLPARLLDAAHGLRSRVAVAVDLLDGGADGGLAGAAVRDAAAQPLDPRAALPLRRPRRLVPALVVWMGAILIGALEVPPPVPAAAAAAPTPPSLLHPDDLAAQREALARLGERPAPDDAVRAATDRLNGLLERLADRDLEREDALRELAELAAELEAAERGTEGVRRVLEDVGRALDGPRGTRETAEALRDGQLDRAASSMRELADALAGTPPSRAELERLRRAVAAAAERAAAPDEGTLEETREEVRSLLRRDREEGLDAGERRLLRRQQRRLERLEREAVTPEQRRRLERLRRELEGGAEALRRQAPEEASAPLERGAEDLNRFAEDQLSERQRRALRRQVEQLRELLRRQRQQGGGRGPGDGGEGGRRERMDRFVLRARGEDGQGTRLRIPGGDGSGPQGQQGQGQQGQGQQGQGQQGQGQQGQGQQGQAPGQGRGPGQGPGQAAGGQEAGEGAGERPDALVLGGPGGGDSQAVLEVPMPGEGGARSGGGAGAGGTGAGQGHDPTALEDPTQLDGRTRNVQVAGERREGPSRSQVIRGAAARGFASRPYQRVFGDYRSHAESVLDTDEIPDGYRFYVRRYFQLIRPRGDDAPAGD